MTRGTDKTERDEGHSQSHLTRRILTRGYLEMESWLETQPERRQAVYRSRFGDPAHRFTLSSLAASFGISREQLRQLENSLLRNLKSRPLPQVTDRLPGCPGPWPRRLAPSCRRQS